MWRQVGLILIAMVLNPSDALEGEANAESTVPAMSADGRYIAFNSFASNLVPHDTNGLWDVFVHDRLTGQTERVSISASGEQGNNRSYESSISADGRYVAFVSSATNLVPDDTNQVSDIFVRDRLEQTTIRVSVNTAGEQADLMSYMPRISADGQWVVFWSQATNLAPGRVTLPTDHIYLHHLITRETALISVGMDGQAANSGSYYPSLSDDGRWITFTSGATNLSPTPLILGQAYGIFLYDRQTQAITYISGGTTRINGDSTYAMISGDGDTVVFTGLFWQEGQANGTHDQVSLHLFTYQRDSGQTRYISPISYGTPAIPQSDRPFISRNGCCIVFTSRINTLVTGDRNDTWDVFVYDQQTDGIEMVSLSSSGQAANGSSSHHDISADGRFIAFESNANNLVSEDRNGVSDIFVHDRETKRTIRVSVPSVDF
ncbi:MAG: hypothetical protein MUF87_10950 [Anaerolineae bacterium]|jgi:Tol biopolymer transport system component|nr:hypothetical protein [Anaerolineae bacterium]